MNSPFEVWNAAAVAFDVWVAAHGSREAIEQRQTQRLAKLLSAASSGSPFYRERLNGVRDFQSIAPVGKRELMNRFDDWVCDPRLRFAALRDFAADASSVGERYDGRYIVWESSGSSGEPGLFVQDARALAVYDALESTRRPTVADRWLDPWYWGERVAFVGATGGHFASHVSIERLRRMSPATANSMRGFSFLQPTGALADQLNSYAPTVIASYPSAALLLAEEAKAGRIAIPLRELWCGGEALTAGMRRIIDAVFGCRIVESYGASEFLTMAVRCPHGSLHLNTDWLLLEPVDERGKPMPPGHSGCTTLLTNLANHVQPLIRYDLGDRVTLWPEPCGCGSPLPAIEVEGRSDEMIVLDDAAGGRVRLLPLALTTVLEDAGVNDFQLVQRGGADLWLSVSADAPRMRRARDALRRYLAEQGLENVRVTGRAVAPKRGRSGKSPRIVAA